MSNFGTPDLTGLGGIELVTELLCWKTAQFFTHNASAFPKNLAVSQACILD